MLFSKLILAASAVSSALAAPAAAHQHNQHKRAVVYVTQTQTVMVTAGSPLVIAGSSTTQTFSTVDTASVSATTQSYTPDAQVVSSSDDSTGTTTTLASTTASSGTATSTSTFSASGKGITYSPYTASGGCKSLDEVTSDLSNLTDYDIIRLYGVDCSQVDYVFQAKQSSQKLFLGLYYMDDIASGISSIASSVSSYGSWDDVYTISIGNELVNSGTATVDEVASYVEQGRTALSSTDYTGPVVSVDTHVAVIDNPTLCNYSDYIAINAHAYFDYNTAADDAGTWLLGVIQNVWSVCGGDKSVFVTETGWPHKGDTYGKAVASPAAQTAAISSIKSTVGDSVVLFNAYDDLWKSDGSLGCEKYWGIY